MSNCDDVYTERNQLVAALTRLYPSTIIRYPEHEEGFQHVVYVHGPSGQMSWHIGDNDLHLFSLPVYNKPEFRVWDGHTTEEKYERLSRLDGSQVELKTVLTYKQAVAVHEALRHAFDTEKKRLILQDAYEEKSTSGSKLYSKLSLATHIMDVMRERAEEGGT